MRAKGTRHDRICRNVSSLRRVVVLVICLLSMVEVRVRFAGGGAVGRVEPPKEFLDPPSQRRCELLGGSILTPSVRCKMGIFISQSGHSFAY